MASLLTFSRVQWDKAGIPELGASPGYTLKSFTAEAAANSFFPRCHFLISQLERGVCKQSSAAEAVLEMKYSVGSQHEKLTR